MYDRHRDEISADDDTRRKDSSNSFGNISSPQARQHVKTIVGLSTEYCLRLAPSIIHGGHEKWSFVCYIVNDSAFASHLPILTPDFTRLDSVVDIADMNLANESTPYQIHSIETLFTRHSSYGLVYGVL
jgi:hypothetical protein